MIVLVLILAVVVLILVYQLHSLQNRVEQLESKTRYVKPKLAKNRSWR